MFILYLVYNIKPILLKYIKSNNLMDILNLYFEIQADK